MMYLYILPSTILLFLIPQGVLFILKNMNRKSIRSTKYFGTLYTGYKCDYYLLGDSTNILKIHHYWIFIVF